MHKSKVLVSNVQQRQTTELVRIFGCSLVTFPFTYLRLPLLDKRLPKTSYLSLLNKLNKRLAGWAAQFLSMVDRLALLNSILSYIPVYFMLVLKLP